jgi:hypothetical protein
MYSVHVVKMYKYNYPENVHVQLSGKMYKYNYSAKCTGTIIRESVHVQLSLLGLSGNHIGNRILLNAIPATLYSVVTNSHRLTTMTSFDTEARKDGSFVACCKSHDPTRGKRCYSSISTYLLPTNWKPHSSW